MTYQNNPQFNANDFPSVSPTAVPNDQAQPSTFNADLRERGETHAVESAPQPYQQYQQNGGVAYTPSYEYDPYNIHYQNVSVDQWQSIPSEQTDYSQYWETPECFLPQNFAKNTKKEHKCNDIVMAIVFLCVVVLTIALFAWTWSKVPKSDDSPDSSSGTISSVDQKLMWKCIGTGLGVALLFNVLHDCYCFFAPIYYIKIGLWVGLIMSVIAVIVPLYYKIWLSVIFPIISLIFSICFYCMCKPYIKLSASIMKMVCKILCRYPSVFLVVLLQCVLEVVISLCFSLFIYAVAATDTSAVLYVYIVFAYFWITITLSYVIYMTISGVASSWYFLNNTEFMPSFPVLMSLKRASTTSLGSAAFAGLLVAIIELLKVFVDHDLGLDGIFGTIINILRCIVMCILRCLECCINFINRYALIYCATFGVPYREGCRRFTELRCNRFCDVIMSGCIISKVTDYNMLVFSIGACLTSYGLGYGFIKGDSVMAGALAAAFGFVFAFALFEILRQPFIVMSDTLLVCFVEAPENLKSSANELYEILKGYYGEHIGEKIK
ncbi:XYPPX repeat family protein [Tritrichomonas foetus]|uniref:Choline transporter-like protein n=1 Tax=Tritrichomonas foetus TaxID=1144522 RepID=A0A1J4JH59_9EUKA|nr:XYPPX repeat family protein [Tritrichomonas foetus]|eukprot:OHS97599.1 XYPPX repeat family protein [Tritrichomonas foetus]